MVPSFKAGFRVVYFHYGFDDSVSAQVPSLSFLEPPARVNRIMAIVTVPEVKTAQADGTCLLGFDIGAKTIGLALSDAALVIA